jgi:hypothetical protein
LYLSTTLAYADNYVKQAKFLANDGMSNDFFGYSVALSKDTAVIGAFRVDDDNRGKDVGAAYVFTRSNNAWIQQAKRMAADGETGDTFGGNVALSSDTAVVGVIRDDDKIKGKDSGSAYIFTRVGTTWSQQVKLTAPDGAKDDRFGRSVALAGDNALIGAMFQDEQGENSGSAYLFKRSGSTWDFNSQLMPKDGSKGDVFGWSVALFGQTALISANRDNVKGENSGSAYIFDFKSTQL